MNPLPQKAKFIVFRAVCTGCRALVISLVTLFLSLPAFSKDGPGHINDALKIALDSNAGKNTPQWDLMSYISQGMDYGNRSGGDGIADAGSGFLKTIRAEFKTEGYNLKGLGQHHYYSHWDFNSSIPKELLAEIREMSAQGRLPPDAEPRFILRWRLKLMERREDIRGLHEELQEPGCPHAGTGVLFHVFSRNSAKLDLRFYR